LQKLILSIQQSFSVSDQFTTEIKWDSQNSKRAERKHTCN